MTPGGSGAGVVEVDRPRRPGPSRGHGPAKDGVGLRWKVLGRNRRTIALDLSAPGGPALAARAARPGPVAPVP
ncbi:CoA transferase [Streptomyces sp. NPDC001744]|uniref:CoA transferase n=1 Tax=Streptomyces sp. NPDC001744 TaxID=3364606 RepID=UPI0036AE06D0